MNISAKPAAEATTVLKATPETVHWGYLDATIQARADHQFGRARSHRMRDLQSGMDAAKGDRASTSCRTSSKFIRRSRKGSGNHIFTGPIYVRDAKPGDVLEVRILDIEIRQNWGWNMFRGYMGTIPEDFPYMRLMHVPLDLASQRRDHAVRLQDSACAVFRAARGRPCRKLLAARTARSRASSAAISIARN